MTRSRNAIKAQVADDSQLTVISHPYLTARPRLATIRGCRRELASLYCAAKAGAVEVSEATKLAYVLKTIIEAIQSGDIEERLTTLEGQSYVATGPD